MTPRTAACKAFLSFTNSRGLLKLMSIKSVMLSNHPHPLSSPSSPAFNLSQHQDHFQWIGSLPQMAKNYWSFNFSISFSNEYSGLISIRIDWLDLLAVQGPLNSLRQDSSKDQFFSTQYSLWSNSHIYTWLLEKPKLSLDGPLLAKWSLCFLICCLRS